MTRTGSSRFFVEGADVVEAGSPPRPASAYSAAVASGGSIGGEVDDAIIAGAGTTAGVVVAATEFTASAVTLARVFSSRSMSCWPYCRWRSSVCRPLTTVSPIKVKAPFSGSKQLSGSNPGTCASRSASRFNKILRRFFCSKNSPLRGGVADGCGTGLRPSRWSLSRVKR